MKLNQAWFVQKKYGIGYMPATWQGWLVTTKYVLGVILISFTDKLVSLNQNGEVLTSWGNADILRLMLDFGIWTSIFILFVLQYSQGDIKWRWGDSK